MERWEQQGIMTPASTQKHPRLPHILLLIIPLALASLPFFFIGFVILRIVLSACFPEKVTIPIPGTEYAVEHSRLLDHIIPAEHDRKITYFVNGKAGATTPMDPDTAGGYPINCYLVHSPNGPFLRLEDAISGHLLDLQNQTTYSVWSGSSFELGGPAGSRVINGALPSQRTDRLLGGEVAEDEYLGRIDGGLFGMRFIPASRSPELKIKKSREW